MVSKQDVTSLRHIRIYPARKTTGEKQHATDSTQTCTACGGAGRLRVDVSYGDPIFGKSKPCACSKAQQTAQSLQKRYQAANLDAFYENTFKTFNDRFPGVQEAFRVCTEFALNPSGWLLLMGVCGCGKTHLATALANQLLESGTEVFFTSAPDLLDTMRAALPSPERYAQFFGWVREVELFVLDDLGAQQSSAWSNEKLLQILDTRARAALPTIITTIPKEFQGMDARLRSRLTDTQLVTTVLFEKARDFRPFKLSPGGRTESW